VSEGGWGGRPGEAAEVSRGRIARTAALQVVGRAGNIALGIAAVALLARALGPDAFGVWSTALAFVGIFGFLTDLGLVRVATQRMAADHEHEDRWLGALIATVAIASLAAFAVTVAAIPLLADEDHIFAVTALLALTILNAAPGALLAVFDSRVRAGVRIAVMTANSVAWLAAIVFLYVTEAGVVSFAIVFVVISALTAALEWGVTKRFARISIRAGRRLWRPLFVQALPLGLAGVLVTVYYRIDSVLVFNISGPDEAGVYGAAYRFIDPVHFLPMSIMAAAFPVMSALHGTDIERLRRLVQRAGEYLLVASLGALAVTIVISGPLVEVLLGADYGRSATVLPILMLGFVFMAIGYLSGNLTPIVGKQWKLVWITGGGVVLNVALNLILVPPYGAVGAAWATVATELIVNAWGLAVVFGALEFRPGLGRPARILLAAFVLWEATAVLALLSPVVALLAAGPIYAGLLLFLRAVDPQDVRDLLNRRRAAASEAPA
jgi:O-antigen/teichoic acid export membrane protein